MSHSHRTTSFIVLGLLLASIAWLQRSSQSTGVSMVGGATEFLGSLTPELRAAAKLPYDSPERVDWHFIPKDRRKGAQIKEMNGEQRRRALALLRTGLSEIGYDKAARIMQVEIILRELEKERKGGPIRDPERYYFTVFGEPAATGKWGWSCEGHHLSLNFVIQDGKLVASTPSFFGCNPDTMLADYTSLVDWAAKDTQLLGKEESLGFDLLAALGPEQRKIAIVAEKAPPDITAAGEAQAKVGEPIGLVAGSMTDAQKAILKKLLETYIQNLPGDAAEVRLAEVKDGFDKITFAWAGAERPGVGHSYRIQGPTFLLELNNTQPDAQGNIANHIHTVWRDTRGDFGISR